MMNVRLKRSLLLLTLCCVALPCFPAQHAGARALPAQDAEKQVYTGTVVGIGSPRVTSRPFTLTIRGTTSEEEYKRYTDILVSEGQDDLLKAIRKQNLGTFQIGSEVGRDVNLVRVRNTPEGRRVTLLFERWLQLFELRYGTRSENYPFTYVELYLNSEGKGEGTMIPAARIKIDKDEEASRIEVENFGIYPARLIGVRARR
jgi:hypothetical protein